MDIEKAKINLETAKIAWVELQRFFAAGMVIQVSKGQDLTGVALSISEDDAQTIGRLIDEGKISVVTDAKALEFFESNAIVWSVVVKPYVLIQEIFE